MNRTLLLLLTLAGAVLPAFPTARAGTNTTVILNAVTITASVPEGELAVVRGNVGDLLLTPIDRYINRVYLGLLDRSVEAAEAESAHASLDTGRSREQFAAEILASSPYRARLVESYHRNFLRRAPTAAELADGVGALAAGTRGEQLAARILGGTEYFQTRASGNNNDFGNALYLDLLGRAIDLNGLSTMLRSLTAGASRVDVAASVLASEEYRRRLIENLHLHHLGRLADAAAMTRFLAALGQGASSESVAASLLGSDEYLARVPATRYLLTVNWGDGVVESIPLQPPVPQNIFFPFEVSHRYFDNQPKASPPQPINVRLALHADTGDATAVAQTFVTNVAPRLRNVSLTTPIGVGRESLLIGEILDPGTQDAFTLTVSWGDTPGAETVLLPAGTTNIRLTHRYQVAGNLTAAVSVRDDDGAIGDATTRIEVSTFISSAAIPSLPNVLPADDSGAASNDAITAVRRPSFTGSAPAGSRVELFSNGQLIGLNTTAPDGKWVISATNPFDDGSFQITARATDSAGNVSLPSPPLVLLIDNVPPLPPTTPDLAPESDNGPSNMDNSTTAIPRVFSGIAERGALVELLKGTNRLGIASVDAGGRWTLEEGSLEPGTHHLTARTVDRAGNVSAPSAPLLLTIESLLLPPSLPDLTPESDRGRFPDDNVTGTPQPSFRGTASPNTTIQLLVDGVVVGTTRTGLDGTWSVTTTPVLADGVHSVTAVASDPGGPLSPPSPALRVTVDTVAPAPPGMPDLIDSSDTGESNSDNITTVVLPTFIGRAEASALVEILANGSPYGEAEAGPDGQWRITVSRPLVDGTYAITARATDLAGNRSNPSSSLSVRIKDPEVALLIGRLPGSAYISWPRDIEGFHLEERDDLPGSVWRAVTIPPTIAGESRLVIIPVDAPQRFFRLRK